MSLPYLEMKICKELEVVIKMHSTSVEPLN